MTRKTNRLSDLVALRRRAEQRLKAAVALSNAKFEAAQNDQLIADEAYQKSVVETDARTHARLTKVGDIVDPMTQYSASVIAIKSERQRVLEKRGTLKKTKNQLGKARADRIAAVTAHAAAMRRLRMVENVLQDANHKALIAKELAEEEDLQPAPQLRKELLQ